ncbi:protein bfr2-like [Spinacia oleracea]|uniref:Protein bfr2-like n=1 Tax=Spinacia oleracea TaxID=3562 RepID=A0ABM3R4T1_SPIOL|nr:protein bfr2-like [Spinacia oleracea]
MVIKGQSGSSSKPREKRVEVARNSKLKGKDPVVDEEMEEDEEGRSLSGDDSEESVFDGDAYEDVEDDEYEDKIYEDEEFEDELCQRTVKRAPKKRQSAKSRRVISYDEVEEEEDIEDEDGEYMDGGYEDEGEDVVVRVQKRGKSWKEVGQNALKKKAHLQMMRKRRREDYDDVDEGRRPVKKTILPAMKQMGRKFDETGVAKGKPPAKQKAIRGNNRRMFVRVPIPKHPMSRGEYAKFHSVVVATQRANCGRKQPSVICRTDAFSKIIAAFDESRRSCVRKMGFGGMLDLKISKLPRQLCYWLMSRLDGGNSYLVGGDGHVLPITASHWEYVIGFQNSGLPVPVKESDLPPGTLKAMALKYGEKNTSTSKSTIIIAKSVKELAGPVDGEGKIKPLANQRDRASFMKIS